MYSEATYHQLKAWSDRGLMLMREILPLMSPVGGYPSWEIRERQTLGHLLSAAARSTESALLLVAFSQLWDAEVMVRSVAEGTLKACYLLQARYAFQQRHKEYSYDLWRISLLKDHQKIEEFLAAVPDAQSREWAPLRDRLLSASKRDEIKQAYSKSVRRALETKWGFTGIVQQFATSGDPALSHLTGLTHTYAMASHILHADEVGTSIPLERDKRSDVRRETVHLAHGVRLISDCFAFMRLRLNVGYRYVGADMAPIVEAWKKVEELERDFSAAQENWMQVEYPT